MVTNLRATSSPTTQVWHCRNEEMRRLDGALATFEAASFSLAMSLVAAMLSLDALVNGVRPKL
jgi:hypothetical protein